MDDRELLERLVRVYSPSGAEKVAVDEFARLAEGLGYSVRVDGAGNGIAEQGRGRPELMFLGHIDTVPGERPVRWRDGQLYGRGAVDAKGALAAALLAGAQFEGPGGFRVVAAVGEETDSRGARWLLRQRKPDAIIAGEPSGWDGVTIGYKGLLRWRATFRGSRQHYSGPAPTAADRAIGYAEAVRSWSAGHASASSFRSTQAHVIACASSLPGDDQMTRIELDLRLPPGLTAADALAQLPGVGERGQLSGIVRVEPWEAKPADRVVRALVAAIRAEGARPTLWRKGGTSDLNLAIARWNVPGAAYGPGDGRLDHTRKERLGLSDFRQSVQVLRRAIDTIQSAGSDRARSSIPRPGGA